MRRKINFKAALVLGVFLGMIAMFQGSALGKEYNWKFHTYVPSTNKAIAVGAKWWCQQVESRSNGQLKVKIYWDGELVGSKELLGAVGSGVIEMATIAPNYFPGQMPLWNLICLPFVTAPRPDYSVKIYARMAKESKFLKAESDKLNLVYGGAHDMFPKTAASKKAIRKVDDLKGVRIWANPDVGGLVKNFGAIPVMMPIGDVFSALDSGILDAMLFAPEAMPQWKIHEVCKTLTLGMDVSSMASTFQINKKTWDDLPDSLKKVVESVIQDYPEYVFKIASELFDSSSEIMKKAGVEFIQFPKSEMERLSKKAPEYWEEWAKRTKNHDAAMSLIADFQRVRNEIVPK